MLLAVLGPLVAAAGEEQISLPNSESTKTSASPTAEKGVVISVARAADIRGESARTVQVVSTRPVVREEEPSGAVYGPSGSPIASGVVSSRFGRRFNPVTRTWGNHRGVDLAAAHGAPVYATAQGRVSFAGWRGSYGLLVVVRHGAGMETRYAHLSAVAVENGASVKDGDVLGFVGSTGRSTGPHLHYEIRRYGSALDPQGSLGR